MDPSGIVSTAQAAGAAAAGVMVREIFSCPLVTTEHHITTTAYLSIVANHVHPFMTAV